MVNWKSTKLGDLLLLANGLVLLIVLNLLASLYFFRVDLTQEKRFSIKPETKQLLRSIEEPVFVEVFLAGELNPSFKRFQNSIREVLEEFRIYSNNKVEVAFTDPSTALSEKARNEYMQSLISRGIQPRNIVDTRDGKREEKIIFPGAIVMAAGSETGVQLLKGNASAKPDEVINQSIEGIEYEIANAIQQVTNINRKQLGFVIGHHELDSLENLSLKIALLEQYDVEDKVTLTAEYNLNNYDALIFAKPKKLFSEQEKFYLDQYIMQGGKVLFLIDKLDATMDSASREDYFAFPYNLNIDDQLFRYGVRLNLDLVQDKVAALYPVVTGNADGKPQMQLLEWPFYPLINRYAQHAISKNLDAVVLKFASTIDTVHAVGISKTPFLFTSPYSRAITSPVKVSINDIRKNTDPTTFDQPNLTIGYLLEGTFTSLYKNRFIPEGITATQIIQQSIATKLIVIADGDIARNEINPRSGKAMEVGFDPFSNYTFANRELLLNAVAWLVNDDNLLAARTKEVTIRPLDKQRIANERTFWQIINVVAPLLCIALFGIVWTYVRLYRFSKF
jgi:ABC-2 type transport system permease protein